MHIHSAMYFLVDIKVQVIYRTHGYLLKRMNIQVYVWIPRLRMVFQATQIVDNRQSRSKPRIFSDKAS